MLTRRSKLRKREKFIARREAARVEAEVLLAILGVVVCHRVELSVKLLSLQMLI